MMEKISMDKLETRLQDNFWVILDFSSPGCAPCKKVTAIVEEVLLECRNENRNIAGYAVDITEEPAIAQKYFVLGVPTILLFKGAKEIARFNGIPKKEKLKNLIDF